jgi:DNA polymerase-4
VVIKPDFTKYRTESRRIMAKVHALTPLVQTLSLDEAWIDLSGTERLNGGSPALQLARPQAEIEAEIGITVSIGLGANKFLAKIASDLDKPRGFTVIGAEEAQAFLAPRPVSILPGVGPAFLQTLERAGLRTVGDLARAAPRDLADRFGVYGLRLSQLSRGLDNRPVDPAEARKGISAETTFNEDHGDQSSLEDRLWPLCEKVAAITRREGVVGRAVVLKLRAADFRIITRRRTLAVPTQTAKTLFAIGRELLAPEIGRLKYRLIGIGVADLLDGADGAGDLFAGDETRARRSETAIDALRAKYGAGAVVSARALRREAED